MTNDNVPRYRVNGSGPLFVYIAGLDGTGELFFKQAAKLVDSYRVVTFRSREGGAFSYDDLTADVAAIIGDNGQGRATILGESFGGTVALSFALRYPSMVERMVIVNSFPRFRRRLLINLGAWLASALPFSTTWIARSGASFLGLLADGVRPEDRRCFFAAIRTVRRDGYARRLKLISEFNVEERLHEIQASTLFIAGEKDLLIRSAREAREMARRMPHTVVRVIEGAGHACLMGNRVNVAQLLKEM